MTCWIAMICLPPPGGTTTSLSLMQAAMPACWNMTRAGGPPAALDGDAGHHEFYGCYAYRVQPNQRNGIYGHGKERYDAIMEVLAMRDPDGDIPADTAWKALQAAAQDPSPPTT